MDSPSYKKAAGFELRVKEQNCLFNISCLNECDLSKEALLQQAVNYLPAGWQFPDIAEAAIEFEGQTYKTANFSETDWVIKSEINDPSGAPLTVKVAYQQEVPTSENGPFLFEERKLIDSIAGILTQKLDHHKLINNLRKMYGLWDRAYDMAGIGHWTVDLVNDELYWSSAIKKLHEVPDDYEPDLESAINFYEEGTHRETIRKAVQQAIDTGKPFDVELKIITAKGNERWIHAVGQAEFQNGKCIRVLGSTQNVTERKIAEKDLKTQKERLERSQQIAKMGYWEFDPETDEITWSMMTYEIFDRDPEKGPPEYKEITSYYYNEEKELLEDKIEKALTMAEPYDFHVPIQTERGIRKHVRTIGIPSTDISGKVVRLLGIVQDITSEKKMEIALKESEERLNAAIKGADLGVWDLNLKTGENYTNTRWWEMLGYDKNEIEFTYDFFLDLLHPDDMHKPAEEVKRIESGGKNDIDIVIRMRAKDGSYRWLQDRGFAVEFADDGSVIRIIGTHMDITEKIELMDDVVQSAIEAEDRERKRIASDLHDGIGQYLGASNMNFESVKHELGKLSPKSGKRFKRGLRLLKRAMEETRKTAYKLMPEALEEYGLILAVESLIENLEKSSEATISFESDIREASLIKRFSINLYRIIQEALNNAITHGQSSNIIVKLIQTDDKIRCTIKDDGIGVNLKDADLEKGLGLRSMKFRAQSMSGSINFDSIPGKGMTITLDIPLNKNVKA